MSEEFGSELNGRVAIAIGASSGIGSAAVKFLTPRGASIVAAARREGKLEELAATIEDDDSDALVVPTDVIVDDDIDALVEATLDEHGRIDILVGNAGLTSFVRIGEADHETLRTTTDVDFTDLITFTHTVVPAMMEQESGHVVNLSSVVGRFLQANSSHYSVAKAGIKMLSGPLRFGVVEAGVHVSSVEPGAVDTELLDYIPDEEVQKNVKDYVGTMDAFVPEDIVRTITFVITRPERVDINEVFIRPLDRVQP